MIRCEHCVLRSADQDDAPALRSVYDPAQPRSCLLDSRREYVQPTLDELREAMAQKELGRSLFTVVEDKAGAVRGFCTLRGLNAELQYSEFLVILLDERDFGDPIADEICDHLLRLAFQRMQLRKVMTHCVDREDAYRDYLVRHGFQSDGVQREVVYSSGRWLDLEAFTLFRDNAQYGI